MRLYHQCPIRTVHTNGAAAGLSLVSRIAGSGLLSTNIAVALFGLAGVVGAATDLSAPLIVLGRVVFGGLAVFVAVRVLRISLRVTRRQCLATEADICIRLGLVCSTVLVGVYVLVPSFSLQSSAFLAVLWGLASAATFALLSVFNRKLGKTHESTVISFYQFIAAAMVLSPVLVWDHPSRLAGTRTVLLLLFLGVACTALAHTMFISGLRHISTMLASLFTSLEPVWGIVFAVIFLGEIPVFRSLLGGLLIISASAVAGWDSSRKNKPIEQKLAGTY
jgi:uncharacterized membrane protein